MPTTLHDILGPEGSIARRLGARYEFRPEQLEMASAVEQSLAAGTHLLVEAGTGVGKSFAYLLPAIDFAVKHKKRVVISTHTISLQEQLFEKDIPLLQSLYPDEFGAVLVKGRSNYLCNRRLDQASRRQDSLFEQDRQRESLWAVEQWAATTTDGSLASLPTVPEPGVWDKVCAEHGNCLGKRCHFYKDCHWQAAKRRMQGGRILVVNHALFFSDLALRMAGVNYLPKYDAVILDEAHTIEDVAGQHFGMKISESALAYTLRSLYDTRRGRGTLSAHGTAANDAIRDIVELHETVPGFFDRCLDYHESRGRGNGRIRDKDFVANDVSPKLRDLSLHSRALVATLKDEEEKSELGSAADKIGGLGQVLEAILGQTLPDAVYWMESSPRPPRRVSLHAAPVDVGEGLRQNLFGLAKLPVVMTSATLCTTAAPSSMGVPPMIFPGRSRALPVSIRKGTKLPHWTAEGSVYAVTFRLADSVPATLLREWAAERNIFIQKAETSPQSLTDADRRRINELFSEKVEAYLDAGYGECWLKQYAIARTVANALTYFHDERYRLLAWCVMPNHVHAVVQPLPGAELSGVLQAWKSYTAHEANRILNRSGDFWLSESYDRLIRDEKELADQVDYVLSNPEKAGLENWKWMGTAEEDHGRDAHATDKRKDTTTDPFAYIKTRLGVDEAQTLLLGSPFDYASQATLYIENDLPEPNDPIFLDRAGEKILHYLRQTNGGAFVLFTSYRMMIDAANRLKPSIDQLGHALFVQGQGAPARVLLERFRNTPDAVLFGTSGFWQGIDVQGDQLRNVMIVKLPFAVPDEPVIEARLDAIKRDGGNAFMEYSVPEAIIKLKQGFGRLIRSKSDRGIVVILDSRITTKHYGKLFLQALPPCERIEARPKRNPRA